jgi:hypothetical protein
VSVPVPGVCCRWHTTACEPPSELCCLRCPERDHPQHPAGIRCVLTYGRML